MLTIGGEQCALPRTADRERTAPVRDIAGAVSLAV